jgi:hypothetical protein
LFQDGSGRSSGSFMNKVHKWANVGMSDRYVLNFCGNMIIGKILLCPVCICLHRLRIGVTKPLLLVSKSFCRYIRWSVNCWSIMLIKFRPPSFLCRHIVKALTKHQRGWFAKRRPRIGFETGFCAHQFSGKVLPSFHKFEGLSPRFKNIDYSKSVATSSRFNHDSYVAPFVGRKSTKRKKRSFASKKESDALIERVTSLQEMVNSQERIRILCSICVLFHEQEWRTRHEVMRFMVGSDEATQQPGSEITETVKSIWCYIMYFNRFCYDMSSNAGTGSPATV